MPEDADEIVEVLVVDDSPADRELVRSALASSSRRYRIHTARDGVEALAVLRSGRPLPGLILLDLHMPRMNGRELLTELRGDPVLRAVPVVVLSGATDPAELREAGADAQGCLRKPDGFDEMRQLLAALERRWLGGTTPPPE
ncbi:MAG TPA: response regulator [Sandaracinaceae bacterium LLY-WYZ-13_1]|nr:response regulator [Sandaracinaceae bacterium LLY-WYZ-13_1]